MGLANGAFWMLAPLYAQSLGFTTRELALFMSVFIAGGAIVQWPLGRLSDGMDRRWIIAATCTAAAGCGLVLGSVGQFLVNVPALFYFIVFVFGAVALPLYSLSVAHANDRLPRSEFVEASAGLLMINAATSIPGPILAAFVMAAAGPSALFLFTAVSHAAMAFYTFTRMQCSRTRTGRDARRVHARAARLARSIAAGSARTGASQQLGGNGHAVIISTVEFCHDWPGLSRNPAGTRV